MYSPTFIFTGKNYLAIITGLRVCTVLKSCKSLDPPCCRPTYNRPLLESPTLQVLPCYDPAYIYSSSLLTTTPPYYWMCRVTELQINSPDTANQKRPTTGICVAPMNNGLNTPRPTEVIKCLHGKDLFYRSVFNFSIKPRLSTDSLEVSIMYS